MLLLFIFLFGAPAKASVTVDSANILASNFEDWKMWRMRDARLCERHTAWH